MRFFQNDLLNDLKKLELQVNGRITSINQLLTTKMSDYDSKFEKMSENIAELISQIAQRKYDADRVEELISMKNKFSDQIIESQSKIAIIEKTLESSLFKYDKIILDNLKVPGLIGNSCKFKNCASYFKYLDNEMQINQKYKEEGVSSFRNFSEKVELRLKKSEGDITKILQSVNRICDLKLEKYSKKIEEKNAATESLILNTRIENSKYATDLIKTSTDLKIQWDKLENIKNEIYGKFDVELENFKKLVHSNARSFRKQEEEFSIFKQRFSQLVEYMRDFKNMSKNYKEMKKDIDFTKKQKLKEDFDINKYDEIGENIKDYIKSPLYKSQKKLYNLKDKKEADDYSEIPEEYTNKIKANNEKNITKKRISLSPNPRRSTTFFNKKKLAEIEKINKITKDGDKRLSTVLTFKNKLKDLNNMNSMNPNDIVGKNSKNYYNTEIKKKEDKIDLDIKKQKKTPIKTLLRKKTIVTENNIDLNFDMENDKDKENSKEEEGSEHSDISSNFSLSSIISLKKIGEDSKDNNEEKDKENYDEENIYSDKEEKKEDFKDNSEFKIINDEKEKKNEDSNKSSTFKYKDSNNDNDEEDTEKLNKRNIFKEKIKSEGKININDIKKENILNDNNNNKKIQTINANILTPVKIKGNSKINKKVDFQNKLKNNIKIVNEKNIKLNLSKEKRNTGSNLSKKLTNFELKEIKQKKNNNKMTLITENKNDESIKKTKSISIGNKQINLAMNEYTNKDKEKNVINKTISTKNNTEITFPQIKTISNEIIKKENSQNLPLKLITNTSKENRKIIHKLFGNNNNHHLMNKKLINFQKLPSNNNKGDKDTLSLSIDKKEEIENKENSENKDMDKLDSEKYKEQEKESEKEKEEDINEVKNKEININDNNKDINEKNEVINIKSLFNTLYDEIKAIKDKTNNNNINKDNINDHNAFLTSLNNINNNYNYYYNSNNINGSNIIALAQENQRKILEDENIKKFNNKIDFINGNIKLVNHRIETLENKYKLILTQLNNIFKIVSTYYHHHKRKSENHHTMRINNKKKTIKFNKDDFKKEGETLDDKKFMMKLKELYNDDYEYDEDYRVNIPDNEYNKTLKRIEPFLIKKFRNKK